MSRFVRHCCRWHSHTKNRKKHSIQDEIKSPTSTEMVSFAINRILNIGDIKNKIIHEIKYFVFMTSLLLIITLMICLLSISCNANQQSTAFGSGYFQSIRFHHLLDLLYIYMNHIPICILIIFSVAS